MFSLSAHTSSGYGAAIGTPMAMRLKCLKLGRSGCQREASASGLRNRMFGTGQEVEALGHYKCNGRFQAKTHSPSSKKRGRLLPFQPGPTRVSDSFLLARSGTRFFRGLCVMTELSIPYCHDNEFLQEQCCFAPQGTDEARPYTIKAGQRRRPRCPPRWPRIPFHPPRRPSARRRLRPPSGNATAA